MENIFNYLRIHRQQHLEELFQLLRMPSVSTDPAHTQDVTVCANTLVEHLQSIGMSSAKVMPTEGHPVVYAEWLKAPDAPTILVYGHYDVQPEDPLELWESPPFEPEIRDGEIYARGVADNKGQFFAYVKAIEAYLREEGRLPINLKLLIEGEEEIGSKHLHAFIAQHADLLGADAVLISDSSMLAPGLPSICYGARGLVACQIDLQSAVRDLHSGGFGGIVANPIQVLADIISALKDRDGRITIPGFYDDVLEISQEERQQFQNLPFDEDEMRQRIGVSELTGEKGYSTLERRWIRPTFDVNGILGGFTGEGSKTIIPARAMAKITMRLVPNQNPEKILESFNAYVRQLTPSTVTLNITGDASGRAYLAPLDHPIFSVVSEALRRAYHCEPVFIRTGGTIGVLGTFSDVLRIPVVMVGLSYPDNNVHAPNEHFNEDAFYKGREVAAYLFDTLKKRR